MTQTPAPPAAAYPVALDLNAPLEVKRWLPLVSWLLVIPHFFVYLIIAIIATVCEIIAFFTILFTKQIPEGVAAWMIRFHRYGWRVTSYMYFLRDPYPAFEFPTSQQDPGDDPAVYSLQRPAEYQRWMPLVKWLLAIPHFIVLYVLSIAAGFCVFVAFFAVLFTGRWPAGLRQFVVGCQRWSARVMAYTFLLVDEYPPFSLD